MNSWPIITIDGETGINIGNTGTDVAVQQTQQWLVSFPTESGAYNPAPAEFYISWRDTNVFYVSGTVAEAGSFVTLSSTGSVPAEFDGKVLTANAVIVTPEIFISKYSDTSDPEPEPEEPLPPRAADGKVETAENVYYLFHADYNVPAWQDSSYYNRPVLEVGLPELDQLRMPFGTGAVRFPDNTLENALEMTQPKDEGWVLEDFSFTWEARLRFDKLIGEQMLHSYGDDQWHIFDIKVKFFQDELMEDRQAIIIYWRTDVFVDEPAGGTEPLAPPDQVEIVLDGLPFLEAPTSYQQTSIVYDKTSGEFAVFIDGVRKGFFNGSERTSPPWNSIFLPPYTDDIDDPAYDANQPLRKVRIGAGVVDTGYAMIGRMDEVRMVFNEALYDTQRTTAQVYNFPWPNPQVLVQAGDEELYP